MFSLYGKCLGFVRNVMDSDDASEKNCYFQSGSKHNYRLASLENTKVRTKNLHSKITPSWGHLLVEKITFSIFFRNDTSFFSR